MKIRDFIKLNADIDVYDDVCEELGICFCGPMMLTDEGKEHFSDVLDYDIDVDLHPCASAVVHIDGNGWKKRLHKAEEFFYSAAGYCADEDYQRWFAMPELGNYATDPDANVYVCVYCDTTPWYTEEEMNKDNLCDLMFPRKMVQEFYVSRGGDIMSFVQWFTEESTADDVDGLFQFCKDRGFIAVREYD